MEFFIFIGGLLLLLWFMSSRTRKQQQAALRFRDDLQPGQEVMTIGRMYGTVVEVDGDRVTLELLDGVTGQWDKSGIAKLVEPPLEDDEEYDDDEYDDDEYDDDEYDDDEYDDDEDPQAALEPDGTGPETPDEDPTRS